MPTAWGHGITTVDDDGATLDAWFPFLGWGDAATAEAASHTFDERRDDVRSVTIRPITLIIDTDAAPESAADVYLRLHLLSARHALPRSLNLDGAFGLLTNVVWTNLGPVLPTRVDGVRWHERTNGRVLAVFGLDKFPRMTDYVIPSGVRVAHADRVRLGAHLAEGTTVMHEGFCNFNAGTLGTSMVEGRISAGVIVGDGSDVGGGASIMGTLSGGGKEVITIGERCLIGANGGCGIALGDDCIIEAGLYVTAGTLVTTPDGDVVKAKMLSGRSNMLFRRNSVTGGVEVIARSGASWGGLNDALHKN
jgi:2,3,4,5-tetrahydropyridine-2-carboxylate N-succinyltransferase